MHKWGADWTNESLNMYMHVYICTWCMEWYIPSCSLGQLILARNQWTRKKDYITWKLKSTGSSHNMQDLLK